MSQLSFMTILQQQCGQAELLDNKAMQIRNKINFYQCSHETLGIEVLQKSRFLIKHAKTMLQLIEKIEEHQAVQFAHIYIAVPNAPLCSKADAYMQSLHWTIVNDTV